MKVNKIDMEVVRVAHAYPEHSKDLITWEDLEPWQKDNEYILTHYRRASWSLTSSIRSILAIHNETANIWSHGLGTIAWLLGLFGLYVSIVPRYGHATPADALAIGIMFASVAVCFVLSTS